MGIKLSGLLVMAAIALGLQGYGQPSPSASAGESHSRVVQGGRGLLMATDQAKNRLVIIDPAAKAIVWQWSATEDATVPVERQKWFGAPSEIKISADKKTIYFACSGGAIGAVSVSNRRLLWYTYSGSNPHSIEPLPDGNFATASSTGNFIKVFRVSGKSGYIDSTDHIRVTLVTAHNVIWDRHSSILWSAGLTEITGWEYSSDKEGINLHQVCRFPLPDRDGHDLMRFDDSTLLLSTNGDIWLFRPSAQRFYKYTGSIPHKGIKSISFFKGGGIIVYPNESWWSDRVYNLDGSVFFQQDGLRLYKARFF